MKRITPSIKAIADAHIKARLSDKFDDPHVTTKDDVFRELWAGKTFSEVLHQVETRYATISSLLIVNVFLEKGKHSHVGAVPRSYQNAIYKGFKILLANK